MTSLITVVDLELSFEEVHQLTFAVLHLFFVDSLCCLFPFPHPIGDLWEESVWILFTHGVTLLIRISLQILC